MKIGTWSTRRRTFRQAVLRGNLDELSLKRQLPFMVGAVRGGDLKRVVRYNDALLFVMVHAPQPVVRQAALDIGYRVEVELEKVGPQIFEGHRDEVAFNPIPFAPRLQTAGYFDNLWLDKVIPGFEINWSETFSFLSGRPGYLGGAIDFLDLLFGLREDVEHYCPISHFLGIKDEIREKKRVQGEAGSTDFSFIFNRPGQSTLYRQFAPLNFMVEGRVPSFSEMILGDAARGSGDSLFDCMRLALAARGFAINVPWVEGNVLSLPEPPIVAGVTSENAAEEVFSFSVGGGVLLALVVKNKKWPIGYGISLPQLGREGRLVDFHVFNEYQGTPSSFEAFRMFLFVLDKTRSPDNFWAMRNFQERRRMESLPPNRKNPEHFYLRTGFEVDPAYSEYLILTSKKAEALFAPIRSEMSFFEIGS